MKRKLLWLLLAAVVAALVAAILRWRGAEPDRVAGARARHGQFVKDLFAAADLRWPPEEIYLRAFKEEGELELWAREGADAFRHVRTFTILGRSGTPGPKRREGDRQVPEGFYVIDRFNPQSDFLLSLGLNYPNESDKLRSDPVAPGSDIFIHGGRSTIGCLPIGDAGIEALFITVSEVSAPARMHIFPSNRRRGEWSESVEKIARVNPSLEQFWSELAPMVDGFNATRRLPAYRVEASGAYEVGR